MIDLNEFAKEVHENAVAHGWWETERPTEEIIALIHSEWSEALEEYRAGRTMIWYRCDVCGGVCDGLCSELYCKEYKSRKPEGIAVELIDGCIRILDYLAYVKYDDIELLPSEIVFGIRKETSVPLLVSDLHYWTAISARCCGGVEEKNLVFALSVAFAWIEENGLDPESIMREKHEYNKTRPYKHGGKVC